MQHHNQVLNKCKEIANEIEKHSIQSFMNNYDGSLFSGLAGNILFQAYYYKFLDKNNEQLYSSVLNKIELLLTHLQKFNYHVGFANGICGIAWLLAHLKKIDLVDIDEAIFSEFDQFIKTFIKEEAQTKHFDYMYGYLGGYLYFLEREDHQTTKTIVDNLKQSATQVAPDSLTWYDSLEEKFAFLGLSHGVAGILWFLIQSESPKQNILLEQGLNWLKFYRLKSPKATFGVSNLDQDPARLAWCHGDLGISVSLAQIGLKVKDQSVLANAKKIAGKTLSRQGPEETGVCDAGFCHGSAGVAHLYARIGQYLDDSLLYDAHEYWIERTLQYATDHNNGFAGYMVYVGDENPETPFVPSLGLLEGISGIGMVLLSYLFRAEMDQMQWDRCFLLT